MQLASFGAAIAQLHNSDGLYCAPGDLKALNRPSGLGRRSPEDVRRWLAHELGVPHGPESHFIVALVGRGLELLVAPVEPEFSFDYGMLHIRSLGISLRDIRRLSIEHSVTLRIFRNEGRNMTTLASSADLAGAGFGHNVASLTREIAMMLNDPGVIAVASLTAPFLSRGSGSYVSGPLGLLDRFWDLALGIVDKKRRPFRGAKIRELAVEVAFPFPAEQKEVTANIEQIITSTLLGESSLIRMSAQPGLAHLPGVPEDDDEAEERGPRITWLASSDAKWHLYEEKVGEGAERYLFIRRYEKGSAAWLGDI